jgi:hypothetical protein
MPPDMGFILIVRHFSMKKTCCSFIDISTAFVYTFKTLKKESGRKYMKILLRESSYGEKNKGIVHIKVSLKCNYC